MAVFRFQCGCLTVLGCILDETRCRAIDFHGELDTELRSAVVLSLKEAINECTNVVVLQKCISSYVCARPDILGPTMSSSSWIDFFVHRKSWQLCSDEEIFPLIAKRRTEVENFFLLHSDLRSGVFAKLLNSSDTSAGNEQHSFENSLSIVIYRVLLRADRIYIEIRMEACVSLFHPFRLNFSGTLFNNLFETIKAGDTVCSRNIHSRSNLLAKLNIDTPMPSISASYHEASLAEDVLRYITVSRHTETHLRFFSTGSGSANKMLSWLTVQHVTSDACPTRASRLCIDENIPILDISGVWLIMRIDDDDYSVGCLEVNAPAHSEAKCSSTFRRLHFFTSGIHDMYPNGENIDMNMLCVDLNASEEHIGVSKIAEAIQHQHAKHYASACYWALRDDINPITLLQIDDVAYAISALSFRESLSFFVSVGDVSASRPDAQNDAGARLWAVIGNLLKIVPGSNDQIFFYFGGDNDNSVNEACAIQSNDEIEANSSRPNFDDPPLFFRFTLDGELTTLPSILELGKSAILGAEVSIHSSTVVDVLPRLHVAAISKLHIALNSFAAEQKLEQYRCMGHLLTEEICREVILDLPKTQHKFCELMLAFFSFKSDSLIPARESIGSNDNGFKILFSEFDRCFTRVDIDTFLAYDKYTKMDILPCWCFVQIRKPMGIVVIQVHHPLGEDSSEEQLQLTEGIVKKIIDRTNQLLLLESLFRTKSASSLLILEEGEKDDLLAAGSETKYDTTYICPVQHTATIPLHRRCAPLQAIMALETTILQNFIVSNRRGVFVYKDESDNVFYMKLRWYRLSEAKDSDRNPNMIELEVYGCDKPGPSITDHLVCLLKKKLLTLTLEALSSLLKKNPW